MGQLHVRIVGGAESKGRGLLGRRILGKCGGWVAWRQRHRGWATAVLCECWAARGNDGMEGC